MRGLNLTDVQDYGIKDVSVRGIFTLNNLKGWVICLSPWIVGVTIWLVVRR